MGATTLPTLTQTLDNDFTNTWYDIKPEATDNILFSTALTAALKLKGCYKEQIGGKLISRTVRYGQYVAVAVERGDTLPGGEPELDTEAFWTFRKQAVGVQRSTFLDRENRGEYEVKSYIAQRLEAATDAMKQKHESDLLRTEVTDESGKELQGLNDMIPAPANRATGTYGKIARPSAFTGDAPSAAATNAWWTAKYKQLSALPEVNLVADMTNLWNTCGENQEYPDLILCDQTLFEIYEQSAVSTIQIIKDEGTKMADLGFPVLRFKGQPMIWSRNMTAGNMLMLHTPSIDAVYDPGMWFDLSEWKSEPNSEERKCHLLNAANVVSDQLRRHGRLYT